MGAESFSIIESGKTAGEAFLTARDQALYDYGHRGYTGTIAEKHEFVVISCPIDMTPDDYASQLMENEDERINDKWGPAGCIKVDKNRWLFFGWASS